MADHSRIKFNPATREIEIEGTEAFVKKYFDVVSGVILESRPTSKKPSKSATAKPAKQAATKKTAKPTNTDRILNFIRESKAGLTTTDLKKKTGLADKQIWPIIYKAEKAGKIKKAGRGLYVYIA